MKKTSEFTGKSSKIERKIPKKEGKHMGNPKNEKKSKKKQKNSKINLAPISMLTNQVVNGETPFFFGSAHHNLGVKKNYEAESQNCQISHVISFLGQSS